MKMLPGKKNAAVETSLIEEFFYPKYGPGQLWELAADDFCKMGGKLKKNCKVVHVNTKDNKVVSIVYLQDGKEVEEKADIVI